MPEELAAKIPSFGIWYVVFLFTLTLHEAGHALVGWLGGDETAYRGGQVTLNPWPHVRREPFGMVFIPLLTFFMSGWMMGWASAPYDPEWGRRHPRRMAVMAAAGPAANLLLAILVFLILKILLANGVFMAPLRVGFDRMVEPVAGTPASSWVYPVAFALSVALNLNVLLFLFNLIPLPPLDGSGILRGLFPEGVGRFYDSMAGNPMMSIIGLLLAWRAFGYIFGPAFSVLIALLHPGAVYE
jgi:Zn-dependent protease